MGVDLTRKEAVDRTLTLTAIRAAAWTAQIPADVLQGGAPRASTDRRSAQAQGAQGGGGEADEGTRGGRKVKADQLFFHKFYNRGHRYVMRRLARHAFEFDVMFEQESERRRTSSILRPAALKEQFSRGERKRGAK